MSTRDEAMDLFKQADANLKTHEDSIRLAEGLGLSVTISMTPECGISMLSLARKGLDGMRAKMDERPARPRPLALWEVGMLCFTAGVLFHAVIA